MGPTRDGRRGRDEQKQPVEQAPPPLFDALARLERAQDLPSADRAQADLAGARGKVQGRVARRAARAFGHRADDTVFGPSAKVDNLTKLVKYVKLLERDGKTD